MNVRRSLVLVFALLLSMPLAAQQTPPQQTPAQQAAEDAEFLKGTYKPGNGVQYPKVLSEMKPNYTSQAMREKIQGDVELQVVIGIDGKVERARVLQSLDKIYGLDEAALQTIKRWTFEPGTMQGKPVPVVVNVNLTFKLH